MTGKVKILSLILLAVFFLAVILVGRDLFLRLSIRTIQCEDGPRKMIDIREFSTQYWGYSYELQANIGDKTKFSGKVSPKQLQQLSESLQQANEFRKSLVGGYNSCAISKAQFTEFVVRFQALDGLSRQINAELNSHNSDTLRIADLVKQYINLTQQLSSGTKQ